MLARFGLALLVFVSIAVVQSHEDPAVTYARRIVAGEKTYKPLSGYVPDAETAISIAKAVLAPIYGDAKINGEAPWHAGLSQGVWTVVGTFNGKGNGGEAIIQIDKETASIKFVGHTM